MLFLITFFTSS